MKTRKARTSPLRSRLVRAVRRGLITQDEAGMLFARGTAAARAGAAPPTTASIARVPPMVTALPAAAPGPVDTPVGPAAAAATESGATCRPVLCLTPAGEYVWRRDGRCAQGVADTLGSVKHQIIETTDEGSLLPPLGGEKRLW